MKKIHEHIRVDSDGPSNIFNFTTEEFDNGLAYEFVKVWTDNPDKFPGTWFEVWRFDQESMTWEVTNNIKKRENSVPERHFTIQLELDIPDEEAAKLHVNGSIVFNSEDMTATVYGAKAIIESCAIKQSYTDYLKPKAQSAAYSVGTPTSNG